MNYFLSTGGSVQGPFLIEQVRQLISDGKIQPDDLVIREDVNQWVEVRSMPEFYQLHASKDVSTRQVGWLLGFGIFFFPWLFSWFTLRGGHSTLARVLAFSWLGLLVLSALTNSPQNRSDLASTGVNPGVPRKTENIDGPSWGEIDAIYNLKATATNVQKEQAWQKFKGKRIWWSGTVSEISDRMFGGYTLQVKMNEDTLTSDLLIRLKRSEKTRVSNYSKGDRISFTGRLDEWGTILPITIDDGEIK